MTSDQALRAEFARAAAGFKRRTEGRFDRLGVVEFARVRPGWTVAEIGAGTGNFLRLFGEVAAQLIAVDLTPEMLDQARAADPSTMAMVADGARLPIRDRSVDLVTSAQTLHHVAEPVPFLSSMARVARGRVLIVDQVATEHIEEARAMTWLETVRDPTHAPSRSPSMFRLLLKMAGLQLIDERVVEDEQRLSHWMWPGEFPTERIEAVRTAIEERGAETGMDFVRDGDDWVFTRRRILLLAEAGGP